MIWQAIVVDYREPQTKLGSSNPASTEAFPNSAAFLEPQQRYRILETLPPLGEVGAAKRLRVLDCQPFQPSLLEALVQEKAATSTIEPSVSPTEDQIGSTPDPQSTRFVTSVTLPAIAKPYLTLQDKCNQALPFLHDTWQQNGQQILLLEDRSLLPHLTDLWSNDELIIPQLQLLHWLYEMVELWSLLETVNSQQSLLETSNLRIDEDQALCLQPVSYTHLTLPTKA
jgi:protein phosphatase